MRKLRFAAVAAAALSVSGPASAATVLNFAAACGGICAYNGTVSQSFGDIANVLDVSYRSVVSNGSTATAGTVSTWGVGYGDLASAIWGVQGGAVEIAFNLLAPNKRLTLNSVTYAAYTGTTVQTQLAIYSAGQMGNFYLPLRPSGALTASSQGRGTWTPNFSLDNGFILHFGADGFNAGIGEITFTISDIGTISAVPEPATWLSMILGFGLVGAAVRRRTARSAPAIV